MSDSTGTGLPGVEGTAAKASSDMTPRGATPGTSTAPTLSYAKGEAQPHLLPGTIGASLERTVEDHGGSEALVEVATGRRWTWAELNRDINDLARGLLAAGMDTGDRLGIWAPNCAQCTLV